MSENRLDKKGDAPPAAQPPPKITLTAEAARELIKVIEEIEREEASQLDRPPSSS